MSEFDKREEGYERAFMHDEELRFRARARAVRRFGLWAAETQGLTGDAASGYSEALVARQFEGADDDALVADLAKALPALSLHRLRRKLAELAAQAELELQSGR